MTRALVARTDNLPVELTSFVDRRAELSAARQLLDSNRLVTLTGPGGVGKTRLSLRVATDARRRFRDGVWLIELASVVDDSRLAQAVASELAIGVGAVDAETALATHFAGRHALLVLDNCEHVIDECARLASFLISACPELQLLATSREPLGIWAEAVLPVPALPVLDPARSQPAQNRDNEAVALFTERARNVRPNYTLTDDDLRVVGEICYRLDGLPLAIELAAVRLIALSPRQILQRLADPYRLLTGGGRSRPDRHRTLRSTIEWSYELCSPVEQVMWARLSVFYGGWGLDAAEALAPDGVHPSDVVDVLQSLIDKSIVVGEVDGERTWYRMLETIRQFGREMLVASGALTSVRRRHRDWYVEFVNQAEADWIGPRQRYWLARLYREAPNIDAALEFCLSEPGQAEAALALTVPVWRLCWWTQGRVKELRSRLDRILSVTSQHSIWRARALAVRGYLAGLQRDQAAEATDLDAAADISAELHDPISTAVLLASRAAAARESTEATQFYEQALQVLADRPEPIPRITVLVELAMIYDVLGNRARAQACAAQVLDFGRTHGELFESSYLLVQLGVSAWRRGDLDEAAHLSAQALRLKRELSDPVGAAFAEQTLACVAVAQGDPRRAATLLGAVDVLWRNAGAVQASFPRYVEYRLDCEQRAHEALGDAAYAQAFADGATMTMLDAIAWTLGERRDEPAADPAGPAVLTRREREIAGLLAEGLSNKQIASRLVIAPRTAEGHVARVLAKLGLNTRTEVAAWVRTHPTAD